MSIFAPLAFIVLLLYLGFGYNNWTLATMIFLFGGIFAGLLAQSDIEAIKQNWNERRCDLSVLVTAHLYKPADDVRTGGEFAAENFNFCARSLMVEFIQVLLKPVYVLLNQQVNVVETLNDTFNKLRLLQANFLKGFEGLMNPFFQRFRSTGSQFGVNYQKFLSAMGRAFGITQAFLYIGMSLVLAVENFVHFVINVIMIIMYIILGLMILIFPLILPVFGLIIFTCQTIGNSSFGYLTEDVCGELCFDPTTKIHLKDGTSKAIAHCQIGDIFEDGTVVEGVLTVSGKHEPIFSLDGIRVSGAHLVWFEEQNEYIPVCQHPSARLSFQGCPILVCLRTSTRTIPLRGFAKKWTFLDWEELPVTLPCSDTIWELLVQKILNQNKPGESKTPSSIPLFDPSCQIQHKTGEVRRLSEVRIGDSIYCSTGFTTVIGIYKGQAPLQEGKGWTDGVWIQALCDTVWKHPETHTGQTVFQEGIHITTESGCFWLQTNQFSGFVRDFTEVGVKNLPLTYTYTRKLLKKSLSREESCVSDSLLQAS
jgi:hypothetical protein